MTHGPMNNAEENGRLSMAAEGATPACEFADWCKFTPYDSWGEVPRYCILCSNVNLSFHRLRRADVCMCSNDIYTITPRRHNRQIDTSFLSFSRTRYQISIHHPNSQHLHPSLSRKAKFSPLLNNKQSYGESVVDKRRKRWLYGAIRRES
jgi:hypothetical protein